LEHFDTVYHLVQGINIGYADGLIGAYDSQDYNIVEEKLCCSFCDVIIHGYHFFPFGEIVDGNQNIFVVAQRWGL